MDKDILCLYEADTKKLTGFLRKSKVDAVRDGGGLLDVEKGSKCTVFLNSGVSFVVYGMDAEYLTRCLFDDVSNSPNDVTKGEEETALLPAQALPR